MPAYPWMRPRARRGPAPLPSGGTATTGNLVIGVVSTANPQTSLPAAYMLRTAIAGVAEFEVFLQRRTDGQSNTGGGTLNGSDIWGAVVAAFRAAAPPN